MRTMTGPPPATIDQYLARLSEDKRAALQRLRETILAVVPTAEECISYGLPSFRYENRGLVSFGAGVNHCAFYPGGIVAEFADELTTFETSKGTIRFQPDAPIPAPLVRRIVKARLAQNVAKAKRTAAARRRGRKKA